MSKHKTSFCIFIFIIIQMFIWNNYLNMLLFEKVLYENGVFMLLEFLASTMISPNYELLANADKMNTYSFEKIIYLKLK